VTVWNKVSRWRTRVRRIWVTRTDGCCVYSHAASGKTSTSRAAQARMALAASARKSRISIVTGLAGGWMGRHHSRTGGTSCQSCTCTRACLPLYTNCYGWSRARGSVCVCVCVCVPALALVLSSCKRTPPPIGRSACALRHSSSSPPLTQLSDDDRFRRRRTTWWIRAGPGDAWGHDDDDTATKDAI